VPRQGSLPRPWRSLARFGAPKANRRCRGPLTAGARGDRFGRFARLDPARLTETRRVGRDAAVLTLDPAKMGGAVKAFQEPSRTAVHGGPAASLRGQAHES